VRSVLQVFRHCSCHVVTAPLLRRSTTITYFALSSIGVDQTLCSCESLRSWKHLAARQVKSRSSHANSVLGALKTSSGRRRLASPLFLSAGTHWKSSRVKTGYERGRLAIPFLTLPHKPQRPCLRLDWPRFSFGPLFPIARLHLQLPRSMPVQNLTGQTPAVK
jgi:hypothetical protein